MKTYQFNLNNNSYKMLDYCCFNFQNSLEPQFNDQCYESCEPMIIKKEYASF